MWITFIYDLFLLSQPFEHFSYLLGFRTFYFLPHLLPAPACNLAHHIRYSLRIIIILDMPLLYLSLHSIYFACSIVIIRSVAKFYMH